MLSWSSLVYYSKDASMLSHFSYTPRNILSTPPSFSSSAFLKIQQYFCTSTSQPLPQTLHATLIKNNSIHNLASSNYILSLYVKSQNLGDARKLFDEMPERDVRTWTILMSGFTFSRTGSSSNMVLDLFRAMRIEGVWPNHFTLSSMFKYCANSNQLVLGKSVHGWIFRNRVPVDVVLANSVLDFYLKCGCFIAARSLFESMDERNAVSVNIMIGGYLCSGDSKRALELFRRMDVKDVASWNTVIDGMVQSGSERAAMELLYEMKENGPSFDKVTLSTALVLAAALSMLKLGRQIHGHVMRLGIDCDGFIRNSLLDMYCKCGEMEKARIVHDKRSPGSARGSEWNDLRTQTLGLSSLVSGYVQSGDNEEAFKIFSGMVREQIRVDLFTMTSIISACANSGILELGKQIHAHITKVGHRLDVHLRSSFINMYAKCGNLDEARKIFREIKSLNIVLWTSTISAFAFHGKGEEAVSLFEQMLKEGVIPNEVTFVGVLTACSHAGLLKEGCRYFELMKEVYGIKPGAEHFTCMVDLYGRNGCLDQIKEFIYENDLSNMKAVWRSFLSSCRLYKNFDMGKWASEKLLKLEPFDPEPYVLLSNMCATARRWQENARIRSQMRKKGLKKQPGQSWIHLKGQVHTFVVGDNSHPQLAEVYRYLQKLIERLKEIGYTPVSEVVMHDVEEEEGESFLWIHSEKLAIAYGLVNTGVGTPIQIMKNLRVCLDCHSFIKFTSQHLNREIIVRDIQRFHHFRNGQCSCQDYW